MQMKKDLMNWKIQVKELSKKASRKERIREKLKGMEDKSKTVLWPLRERNKQGEKYLEKYFEPKHFYSVNFYLNLSINWSYSEAYLV